MHTHNWYYGLIVQEDQMDEAFNWAEQADWKQNEDCGLTGIVIPNYTTWDSPTMPSPPELKSPASWTPNEDSPKSWDVNVTTGYAYDKDGKRMAVDPPTTIAVDCEYDYLSQPNSVGTGKERWISLFLKSKKTLSDPQVDDNGATVYFVETESYEVLVYQGPEETAPATSKPSFLSDGILIVDINIDENTGSSGIADGDMDFKRTEFLVNIDLSGVLGSGAKVVARNLEEAIYFLAEQIGAAAGDIIPGTTCASDLGSSTKRWKKEYVQAIDEKPDKTYSNKSVFEPSTDWEGIFGHSQATKIIYSMDQDWIAEYLDTMGRRRVKQLEDVEDFLQYNTHAGPWPFRFSTTGSPTYAFNPTTFAQNLPGGHVEIATPSSGDVISIYRATYPLLASREANTSWGIKPTVTSGYESIIIGVISSPGAAIFAFVYDPQSALLTSGNANWWAYYYDATNPLIEIDTGIAFATGDYIIFETAFEYNVSSGNLYVFWYLRKSGSVTTKYTDLTSAGGTYQSLVEARSWDINLELNATHASAGGEEMLVDFYDCKQFRSY